MFVFMETKIKRLPVGVRVDTYLIKFNCIWHLVEQNMNLGHIWVEYVYPLTIVL